MLVGTGHAYFWAGGAPPPPEELSFQTDICEGFVSGGSRGGFRTFLLLLVLHWVEGVR